MIRRIAQWCGWQQCRFCREWCRTEDLLGDVCGGCVTETLAWLKDVGWVVTIPLEHLRK